MSLSQYLKTKASFLYAINGSVVLLLVILQLAAWYPFLFQAQEHMNRHTRLKDRANQEWQQTQKHAKKLQTTNFVEASWARHRVEATQDGVPTKWSLEGIASVAEWQGLLEKAETQFALGLFSVYWQREPNGQWQGRFLFTINKPKANREYHHWLPTKLRASRFIKKDWHLLSTMRTGKDISALVTYKKKRHWVRENSWLPEAGFTVNAVSFDRVILIAKDGSQQTLIVREGKRND